MKTGTLLLAAAGLLLAASFTATAQQQRHDGYWVGGASGIPARSGYGLCVRAGYWTPALATADCDADLMPKPAAAPAAQPPAPPAPPPPPVSKPAAKPKPLAEKITLAVDVFFDFDKSIIKPEGKAKLDDLSSKIRGINLEVVIAVGHTDWVGTDEYNQRLSVRRSEAVKAYLVSKGSEANRVYTEGKGEKQPVASNKTKEGRAKNRRAEIEVIGTRK